MIKLYPSADLIWEELKFKKILHRIVTVGISFDCISVRNKTTRVRFYYFVLLQKNYLKHIFLSKIEFFVEQKNTQDQERHPLFRFNVRGKDSRHRSSFFKRTAPDR